MPVALPDAVCRPPGGSTARPTDGSQPWPEVLARSRDRLHPSDNPATECGSAGAHGWRGSLSGLVRQGLCREYCFKDAYPAGPRCCSAGALVTVAVDVIAARIVEKTRSSSTPGVSKGGGGKCGDGACRWRRRRQYAGDLRRNSETMTAVMKAVRGYGDSGGALSE